MEQTAFLQYVQRWFPSITDQVVAKLNDTTQPLSYLHTRMLRPRFSVSGKWEAISASNTRIMAHVVALNSPLPLAKRDAISKANGDIVKMGLELYLNEKQLTDLDTLIATNVPEKTVLQVLFDDTPKVITAVYERCEEMFLQALSSGVTLVDDPENVGTGVRLDFGYKPANKFGVSVLWSNPSTAKPWDDIKRVLDKAKTDGYSITKVMLDSATLDKLAATDQTKQLYAFISGFVGGNIPIPDLTQINALAQRRYGFVFEIVDRTVRYEKNGVQTSVKPWVAGSLTFLTSDQVGTLDYARLAEQNRPVAGVEYTTANDYILVSKYRENKPLSEFTSSQARVVPVINNVDQIYLMDSTTVQA